MAANDQRDAYLSQFGPGGTGIGSGFNNLAALLTKSTGEAGGGQLFKNLIGQNDTEGFQKAMAAVNEELARYAAKTGEATAKESEQAAAIAATKAQLDEKTAAIHEQMQGLDEELKRLDASEAPEKHMGTVEKRARERIAREKEDLQKQLDAAKEAAAAAIEAIKAAGTASSDELKSQGDSVISDLQNGFVKLGDLGVDQIDRVRKLLEEMQRKGYHVPVSYDTPPESGGGGRSPGPQEPQSTTPGYASGTPGLGFVDFGREQLVRLHGPEAVIPMGSARQAAQRWGSSSVATQRGTIQSVTIMQIDKREIGRAVADVLPGELRRLGVRVRA
jgi:hypothetical protein